MENYKIVERIENITTPSFKRLYNEEIFDATEEIFNNSYVQLCISSQNINKAQYVEKIKDLKTTYLDSNIRLHVIDDDDNYTTLSVATFNTNIETYINNNITNTADIHNAHVYYFRDPIDTGEMIAYMERIIQYNIFERASDNEDMIPTVIVAPRISRDASGLLTKLVTYLYTYNKDNMQSQKPPILVITNISGTDEDITNDIAKLCRCRDIAKYIDPNIQEEAQKKGEAPTIDNIHEWYGECELVVADTDKTKFIRSKATTDENDTTYDMLINFLKAEIKKSKEENADALEIGRLKKRLRCLEANMVEYLIGGITVSDRDSVRDLVEDAVKNCASAAENGVGYAANFEGLNGATNVLNAFINTSTDKSNISYQIAKVIELSYRNAAIDLYKSVVTNEDEAREYLESSLKNGRPFNVIDISKKIDSERPGEDVLTSINTDIEILNAISKIVTIMVTANQALVQTPELNRY